MFAQEPLSRHYLVCCHHKRQKLWRSIRSRGRTPSRAPAMWSPQLPVWCGRGHCGRPPARVPPPKLFRPQHQYIGPRCRAGLVQDSLCPLPAATIQRERLMLSQTECLILHRELTGRWDLPWKRLRPDWCVHRWRDRLPACNRIGEMLALWIWQRNWRHCWAAR